MNQELRSCKGNEKPRSIWRADCPEMTEIVIGGTHFGIKTPGNHLRLSLKFVLMKKTKALPEE